MYSLIEKPSTYILFKGKVCQVVGIAYEKTIIIEPLKKEKCKCGREYPNQQESYVESAPIFQDNVKPVPTIDHEVRHSFAEPSVMIK